MHSKSDNIELMTYDNADEEIEKLFESLLNRYQIGLERSMRSGDFTLDCGHLLYYKCYKINSNCCGSYIDSFGWIKNKKTTINAKYFQYAATESH